MAQRLDVRYVAFQTDGTAAREAVPLKPYTLLHLPKLKPTKKLVLRIDPVAVAGIVMSVFMVVMLAIGFVQLHNAREDAALMDAYVEHLEKKKEDLLFDYQKECDLEQVRITAQALGLVPIDQVRHIKIQPPEITEPEQPSGWERFCTFLTGLFA